ncbi:hypothetical protein [Erwinia aphidicola]|uniref:Uncharacterized protein n=1 Tax=Erwinia aphidicola TaxID=68334 RepID=A0ABU8DJH5_ERWAP
MSHAPTETSTAILFFQSLNSIDFILIVIFFIILFWVIKIHKSVSRRDKKIEFKLALFLTVIVLFINLANLYSVWDKLPTEKSETRNSFNDM